MIRTLSLHPLLDNIYTHPSNLDVFGFWTWRKPTDTKEEQQALTFSLEMLPKSFTSTSDGRMLSDHQQDGSADCVETPQEEHVLLLLPGRVRVMMVHRDDGRSAFQPDLCSHNREAPTISNKEVSCWAGAPAIKWGQSGLWKYLHWHGEHTCKYHNRFFLTLQWWYSGNLRVEQNLKRISFGWCTANCCH